MSYTTATVIHRLAGLTVTSYGNGAAYAIDAGAWHGSGRGAFLQGDDAEAFREELEKLDDLRPCPAPEWDARLREICEEYLA